MQIERYRMIIRDLRFDFNGIKNMIVLSLDFLVQ